MHTTRSGDQNPGARLAPAAADQLGIGEITLLVIRPDGHVGLRADRDHIEALPLQPSSEGKIDLGEIWSEFLCGRRHCNTYDPHGLRDLNIALARTS